MSIAAVETENIDYGHCSYGASRLTFRGPPASLDRPYVAVIGGSETFGRFVRRPFPTLLADQTGMNVVNLGCMNAGLTAFSEDETVRKIASGAAVTVLQVPGAENMSNRYYMVHPRRNDRFLSASDKMTRAFPDVDFTEFHFTRHMLRSLLASEPRAFEALREELRTAWEHRMRGFLRAIQSPVLLLWMSERGPEETSAAVDHSAPLFVDGKLVRRVASDALGTIVATPGPEEARKLELMTYMDHDRHAAEALPGPAFHARTAEIVADALRPILAPEHEKRRAS